MEGQPPKRRARRTQTSQAPARARAWATGGVGLDAETHSSLSAAAKKLGHSKTEFAAAAIRYFVTHGLDPMQASGLKEGALTRHKVDESAQLMLKRLDENTNRLVSIQRRMEQQLYQFHEEVEGKIFGYLETIERNLLQYLVGIETQVLVPLLEIVLRGTIDSHLARLQSEHVRLHLEKKSETEIGAAHAAYDELRERELVQEMRKLLEKYRLPKPDVSPAPRLTVPQVFAKRDTPAGPATPTKDAPADPDNPNKDYY